jgi:hypothetical protein
MRGTVLGALTAGLVAGVTLTIGARHQDATAQPPQKLQAWDYKVVEFWSQHTDGAAESFTNRLQRLAADRWEYVGPVNTYQPATPANSGFYGYIAFRRPR